MTHRTVALAGNPNTGKSSIFNALTGSRQHTGNWPGKTVLKRVGSFDQNGNTITLVDLPGSYSLSAISPEEAIARDYLLSNEPDAAIVVVDAANLERNLYLAVQVLETGLPSVVALNMVDVAERRGLVLDAHGLAAHLQAPVVATSARTGAGVAQLGLAVQRLVPVAP